MTHKQLMNMRRAVFLRRLGMDVRERREWCRSNGYCLRCLVRRAVKWKRCSECLNQHSKRPGPHGRKKGGKK